jgi:hypothetical protein
LKARLALVIATFIVCVCAPTLAAAQSSLSAGAVRALEPSLKVTSTRTVDLDADGDLDELHSVVTTIGHEHCVATIRTPQGWVAHALTGPGGDREGRCVSVVAGVVIVALLGPSHSEGPAVFDAVDLNTATVTASGAELGRWVPAGDLGRAAWQALVARASGADVLADARGVRPIRLRRRLR